MARVSEVRSQGRTGSSSAEAFARISILNLKSTLTVGAGYGPLLREYVYFLLAKLAFHRQHPEFNGESCVN